MRRAELGDDLAVHLDAALDDVAARDAPGRDARRGEHLLQAHALGRVAALGSIASVKVESLLAVVEQRRDVRQLVERVDAEVA